SPRFLPFSLHDALPIWPSPFDEFMARFFSTGDQRPSHRVDITRLMTQQAQEMLANAVRLAADRHTPDLDATHLLWAATQNSSTRSEEHTSELQSRENLV